jgi:histidyl-tRNA synthetase
MDANPLRVLDSKREEDVRATADAPRMVDYLGDESREHFDSVRSMLDDLGIEYTVDSRLVRGLDYYTRTAYEFQGLDLGAQDALLGGGRYDALIEEVGGKPTPAIGFGAGMERLILARRNAGSPSTPPGQTDVYLVALDDEARRWASRTAHELRLDGVSVETDLLRRSMIAQLRDANRRGARFVVIVGGTEMESRVAQVKSMADSGQSAVPFDEIVANLVARLRP